MESMMPIVKTARLGPFLGENNRLKRYALDVPDAGSYIAGSNNVDIDNSGKISRANGSTLVQALTTGRSLFSANGKTLFADGTSLKSIADFSPFSASTLDTVSSGRVAYAAIGDDIYYTDGAKIGRIDASSVAHPVGISVPVLSSGSAIAGTLDAASYQYAITYFKGNEEGGASASRTISLGDGSGIQIDLPAPPTGVTHIGVYVSGPNGEIPLLHSRVVSGTPSVSVTSLATGRQCLTRLKGPMPAGDMLAHLLGRLFVADGATLYYSDAYNFSMTAPARNYLQFSADISVLAPCVNGVYVVADKTYWLTGVGSAEMSMIPVLPYGAVSHSEGASPKDNRVFWLSQRGLVIGDSSGQVVNVQEKALLLDLSGVGASLFMEGDSNRIITTNG